MPVGGVEEASGRVSQDGNCVCRCVTSGEGVGNGPKWLASVKWPGWSLDLEENLELWSSTDSRRFLESVSGTVTAFECLCWA